MKQHLTTSLLILAAILNTLSVFSRSILTPADRVAIYNRVASQDVSNGPLKSISDCRIEMLVRFSDETTLRSLRDRGAEVMDTYGSEIAVVSIPADKAEMVLSAAGVKTARVARKLHLLNNKGRAMSAVEKVWNGDRLPEKYDGSNVVVGIYDIGIDANHPHFTDNHGNSRVRAIYRYPDGSSDPVEYITPEQIARFTSDDSDECHGSHVLGTITGAFHVKGLTDYRGVAPGAEIVITTGQGYESQILDAIKRVGEYGRQHGLPTVMNLSWGDNIGPHDGSDEFVKAMNDMAVEYDMVIAVAAGNERDEDIAVIKDLTDSDTTAQTLLMRGTSSVGDANQGYGQFQVWTTDTTPFTLHLDVMRKTNPFNPLYTLTYSDGEEKYLSSGNKIYDYIELGDSLTLIESGTNFHKYYKNSFVGGYVGVNSANNRYCADMYSYLNMSGGSDIYIRVRVEGKPGQRIFIYTADNRYQQFGSGGMSRMDVPNGNGTNSNMASGPNTMSVGSYVSNNIPSSGYPTGTIGDMSYFSSYGPTPDGRFIPDLSAPGQVIVSARNQHLSSTYNYSVYTQQDDPISGSKVQFTTMSGTSQATPNAAGCAAIIRQIVPDYSYRQVIDLLKENCTSPEYDEEGWGSGRINLHAAAMAAVKQSGISGNEADTRDMITLKRHNSEWLVVVPSASRFIIEIFNINGHLIHQIDSYESEHIISTETLPHGIYLLRVTASTQSRTFKISN